MSRRTAWLAKFEACILGLTTGDDCGARDEGVEDKDAGELGKPFTQTEDDEEWKEWIDWGALGGGSGDAA